MIPLSVDTTESPECASKRLKTSTRLSSSSPVVASSLQTSVQRVICSPCYSLHAVDDPLDIIDGNLKLILGMIWTLVLRFTIADITYDTLLSFPYELTDPESAKRVFLPRKAFSCGVNERLRLTKRSTSKTFHIAGKTVSRCISTPQCPLTTPNVSILDAP